MNADYCFMHIILLIIVTVIAGIATVAMLVAYFGDTVKFAGVEIRQKKWLLRAFSTLLLFVGGLSWMIHSSNQPWRTTVSTFHEIKDVSYPDGTKVQMFTVDGSHINVTSRFGKILDQDWVIHRVRYAKGYAGVSWSSLQETWHDHFFLEKKTKDTEPIELSMPNEDQIESRL